jgi:NAD-dependent deacetylase
MRITILTGAGISAESGISTFRDSGGLWDTYDIDEVASIDGYRKNPNLVNEFYNIRRKQLLTVTPNAAHIALATLQNYYDVTVITQNVDDLHERAGSNNIIHLHGELLKSRDIITGDIYDQFDDITPDTLSPNGNILRPNIVWFGELVDSMIYAVNSVVMSDLVIVIGTSLNVYPAAGLTNILNRDAKLIVVDPESPAIFRSYEYIKGTAVKKVPELVNTLINGH